MRILIADDHEVIRRGVARVLQSRGDVEEYSEAINGEEAVEKALEWKPDLILLDIQMPLLDGFAVARKIKQQEPGIPILFFSIYDRDEILEEARSVGDGFLLKEKIVEMLPNAVEALLRKQRFFPSSQDFGSREQGRSDECPSALINSLLPVVWLKTKYSPGTTVANSSMRDLAASTSRHTPNHLTEPSASVRKRSKGANIRGIPARLRLTTSICRCLCNLRQIAREDRPVSGIGSEACRRPWRSGRRAKRCVARFLPALFRRDSRGREPVWSNLRQENCEVWLRASRGFGSTGLQVRAKG